MNVIVGKKSIKLIPTIWTEVATTTTTITTATTIAIKTIL